MQGVNENKLLEYINSQARNKVVFFNKQLLGIEPIDLGIQIAQRIYNYRNDSKLALKVTSEIEEVINNSEINHSVYGKVKALSNLGILMEPDLKQDLTRVLEKHSIGNTLFIKWDGEIDEENIYFLTKEKGIKINIKNLSHIVI